MGRSVWVIEQGSYSDYRVVGVYTSRRNAQLVVDRLNTAEYSSDATIAKWSLDPGVDDINAGLRTFLVTMDIAGGIEQAKPWDLSAYEIGGSLGLWKRTDAPSWKGKPISDAIHGTVWASDEQHAVKIANERRLEEIAAGRMKSRG